MRTFIGTKIIKAKPMTRAAYNLYRGWELPANENGEDDGFLVEYTDGGKPNDERHKGYISWSPTDVFERAYRPMTGLSFGLAIEALKAGARVARSGWNGKGMFIYHVPANSYPAQTGAAKDYFGQDAMVPYRAYLAMKTTSNDVVCWAPTVSDALAEDWYIAE